MIIHRMSTQAPEPPVRFYKVIALSFLFLTILLLGVVIFITSKRATITILTKQDTETVTFNAVVGGAGSKTIPGLVTSTLFSFSKEFSPTGNKQIEDNAKGTVTLYNKTSAAQTLVKTTRLLSEDGVMLRLSMAATIPAKGEVKAEVYADQKGVKGNIGPSKFTIPGLNAEKQKVIYAESKEALTGGLRTVGVLSAEDIASAKNEYEKEAEDAFLKSLSEAGQGIERAVKAVAVNTVVDRVSGEEVSSFKVSGTSTMVVAEYRASDLTRLVNAEVASKVISGTERYISLSGAPVVALSSADLQNDSATLSVREEVALTLDANSEKLSSEHFFGKSKDEISRYVMGLDHVANVDVKFSPAWVLSAPAVADRISVVVRSVK